MSIFCSCSGCGTGRLQWIILIGGVLAKVAGEVENRINTTGANGVR
jgi:hypothetical protein